jgi:hypothetical protein
VEFRKFPGCDGAGGVVVRRLPDPKAPKRHGDPAIKSSIGPEMPRARPRHAATFRRRPTNGLNAESLKDQNARLRAAPGPFPCAGTD